MRFGNRTASMAFDQDQIDELKSCYPNLGAVEDGEKSFILISPLPLPVGCVPQVVDGLLCPFLRDGYGLYHQMAKWVQKEPFRQFDFLQCTLEIRHPQGWPTPGAFIYCSLIFPSTASIPAVSDAMSSSVRISWFPPNRARLESRCK